MMNQPRKGPIVPLQPLMAWMIILA